MMDIAAILDRLPHRYPFLLVDRVIEAEEGKRIVAIKNVTINEPFFPGHFPDRPIMPGVLQIEALAQAACLLCSIDDYDTLKERGVVLAAVDKTKFKRPVVPGDQARLEVELTARRGPVSKFRGRLSVDGKLCTETEFTAAWGPGKDG